MESIDRLREFMTYKDNGKPHYRGSLEGMNTIRAGLDAIEREAMEERTAAYNEGYDAGFASADDWAAQHEDAMAEHGWIRLPVDADGEPIHVGDVMESDGGETFRVCRLQLFDSGWAIDGGKFTQSEIRHHRAPTVEDVLREFADGLGVPVANSYLAATAAKLQLAGEE